MQREDEGDAVKTRCKLQLRPVIGLEARHSYCIILIICSREKARCRSAARFIHREVQLNT